MGREIIDSLREYYNSQYKIPFDLLDTKIRLADVQYHKTTAGPGLRTEVFFQGCTHTCEDCCNANLRNWAGGRNFTVYEILGMVDSTINPGYYAEETAVTIGGGEPFDQLEGLLALVTSLRMLQDENMHLLVYSGYTLEELQKGKLHRYKGKKDIKAVLQHVDVLVDGLFMNDPEHVLQRTSSSFIGSNNQHYHILSDKGKVLESISAEIANGVVGDARKDYLWEIEKELRKS